MKQFLFLFSAVLILNGAAKEAFSQVSLPAASPSAVVSQGIGLGEVRIEFSRPSLKGRKMFGSQLPYDAVWRTGANKVTNIIFSRDMEIAGHTIIAGKYALLTIPSTGDWTVILNKDADAWGAYTYKEASDVLRFKVKPETLKKPQEHFSISFDDFTPTQAYIVIQWENTRIKFPVKHHPDAEIMEQIRTLTSAAEVKPATYIGAANYYFDTNRDLEKAYQWASKALESNQAFWVYALRAKIAAKIGKCDVAVQDAKAGLPEAKKANDMSYVLSLEKLIKDCGK